MLAERADFRSLGVVSRAERCSGCAPGQCPETLRRLGGQQSLAREEQVAQCAKRKDLIGILLDSPVANLYVSELQLDHREDVLYLGPHPRLVAVLRTLHFINTVLVAVAFVGHVLSQGCGFADDFALSAISLIAPDFGFIAMQQFR